MSGSMSPASSADPFVLAVGRVHDGLGFLPDEDLIVVVAEGAIVDLGPRARLLGKYSALPFVNHSGAVLTPGWIDTHVHSTMPGDGRPIEEVAPAPFETRIAIATANLRAHLAGGVTTVRDLGSHLDYLAWSPGPGLMPRVLRYGMPITAERGHMHLFGGALNAARTVADVARANLEAGADGLKLVASGGGTVGTVPHETTLGSDQVAEAVRLAHARGKRVTVHALTNGAILAAAAAGADGIEHLGFLTADGLSRVQQEALDAAVTAGIVFGSTLGCNEAYLHLSDSQGAAEHEEQSVRTEYYRRNADRLLGAGGRIAVGTDAGWKHTPFGAYSRELQLLAGAGVPAERLLHLATAGNADALGVPGLTGMIRPGHPADLVVMDGVDFATRASKVLEVVVAGRRLVPPGTPL
ncbi:amidohydrolase family protein [Micromonospora sp. NBC_01655]|uniref:amidohydrolase family protein n=1 Tax=Micromonospora sp. NBC_01655 TaxID=2975983 RepID=UPI0022546060|nr:amidohydrolase family protein [Micromonospora sp. NBC_01655]MCX4469602.1 amidohydrolase family protein [Micromonospora sp. NBC_01655]